MTNGALSSNPPHQLLDIPPPQLVFCFFRAAYPFGPGGSFGSSLFNKGSVEGVAQQKRNPSENNSHQEDDHEDPPPAPDLQLAVSSTTTISGDFLSPGSESSGASSNAKSISEHGYWAQRRTHGPNDHTVKRRWKFHLVLGQGKRCQDYMQRRATSHCDQSYYRPLKNYCRCCEQCVRRSYCWQCLWSGREFQFIFLQCSFIIFKTSVLLHVKFLKLPPRGGGGRLKMKSADLEGEHSVSGDARESKSYFPEVQKVSAADIGERLAGADPYWRHLLETLLLNATVAKSVAALAVTGKFFPFVALASSTAVAPAPPRANANRQIATVPGPGSDRSWALTNANGQPKEEEQFMELIFPGFDGDTFIWNVTLAQIAAFAFTMWVGHQKANPTPCALYLLGASWGPALARGQLWRLVCPMMLHANMMHLFFNVFFQLRIGFGMEKQFGKSKMRSLYVMCGVIGNLISVMLDPFKLAVGASTAGFGLIGVWIAEIVMSWDQLGANRDRTLIWILFMLVSVTTMSGMTPNMDLYGHFGGALGGFLMALIMSDMKPEQRPPWYNAMKKLGFAGLAGILGAGIWKVGFHTPLSPIPDCSMFGALFSKLM
eukprot:g5483.t1